MTISATVSFSVHFLYFQISTYSTYIIEHWKYQKWKKIDFILDFYVRLHETEWVI